MPEISLIIPLYNEEACVPRLIESLRDFLSTFPRRTEVILVDDGSRDRTYALVEAALPNLRGFRLARLRKNSGQTAAMSAGLELAEGDIIVFMDGDLQNDPSDIPALIAKLEEGYDLVSGWRRDRKDRALTRRFPSYVANRLISLWTGVHLHDYGCTIKAYRARVLKSLRLYSDMHRFLPAFSQRAGAKVTEIVVRHHPRTLGVSKYGLSRVMKVAVDLLVVKLIVDFSTRPMHFFGLGSLVSLGLSACAFASWLANLGEGWQREKIIFPALIVLGVVTSAYFLFVGLLADLTQQVGRSDPAAFARSTAEIL